MSKSQVRRWCFVPGLLFSVFAPLVGCRRETPTSAPTATVEQHASAALTVLVLDDPGLAEAVRAEWSSRSETEVSVRSEKSSRLWEATGPVQADVVIYPEELLGELIGREWIVPLPSDRLDETSYEFRDILDTVRTREMAWGDQTWGVSFGSPGLVLYYRADLFDRFGLKPPADWAEYRATAARLADRSQLGEAAHIASTWSGTLEPLGPGWAARTLLARAAPYARHPSSYSTLFDYRTMRPLVERPSFVRALQELSQVRSLMADDCGALDVAGVRERFFRGEAAMAIAWPSSQSASGDNPSAVAAVTGLAPLPGAADVFNFRTERWEHRPGGEVEYVPLLGVAGRLGSVTRESHQPRAATRLLMWFTGPELGSQISRAGKLTGPYRESHLGNAATWLDPHLPRSALQQFTEIIKLNQSAASWLVVPNLPGGPDYLKSLDEAVRSVGGEEDNAESALQEVASRWQAITERRGVEKQKQAYMRSLGLLNE